MAPAPAANLTLVDTASLFHAGEAIASETGSEKRLSPRYDMLLRKLEEFRAIAKWPKADLNLALAAVDRNNPQQQRFVEALRRAGFDVDAVDFRETFPSIPPSLSRKDEGRPAPSFTARIAYIAGLLARRPKGSLLVVTHSVELLPLLLDLAARLEGGRVGVAYFGCLLEPRWRRLKEMAELGMTQQFFDLDDFSQEIFGVDISTKAGSATEVQAGLNRF
jgi:hypothetical protein